MKNTDLKTVLFLFLFSFLSSLSFAQVNKDKTLTNSLDEITITAEKVSLEDTKEFIENKKHLRKAARKSDGDINTFKNQVLETIPAFSIISDTKWEKLYNESKLLTFIGKIEELPSVL